MELELEPDREVVGEEPGGEFGGGKLGGDRGEEDGRTWSRAGGKRGEELLLAEKR